MATRGLPPPALALGPLFNSFRHIFASKHAPKPSIIPLFPSETWFPPYYSLWSGNIVSFIIILPTTYCYTWTSRARILRWRKVCPVLINNKHRHRSNFARFGTLQPFPVARLNPCILPFFFFLFHFTASTAMLRTQFSLIILLLAFIQSTLACMINTPIEC